MPDRTPAVRPDYPHEFLGRCQTCLDNAFLSDVPCKPRMGQPGHPVIEDDCLVRRAQKRYDKENAP